jgi:hypothetical protein
VRVRLLLTWGLTSSVPLTGLALLFLDPSNPQGPNEAAVVFLVVALLVGRSVGAPVGVHGHRRRGQRGGRLSDLAKDDRGRALVSHSVVRTARGDEELHRAPGGVVELRGRDEPTRTWVLSIG